MISIPVIAPTTKSPTGYLRNLQMGKWHLVKNIPVNIQQEVIEILTTGKISTGVRVIESDDWTAFMLVPGITRIPKNQ